MIHLILDKIVRKENTWKTQDKLETDEVLVLLRKDKKKIFEYETESENPDTR